MRFRFIEDHRADYPVRIMCGALEVSPAGYYAWRSRPESRRSAANRDLLDHITQVHRDTRGRYGSPRIHVDGGMPPAHQRHLGPVFRVAEHWIIGEDAGHRLQVAKRGG